MNPPDDLTPQELWASLTAMPRPTRLVDYPRINPATEKPVGQVAMWILTQQEHMRAGIAAEKLVRTELADAKKGESIGYEVAYANASAVEVLVRSCRKATSLKEPAFPSPLDLRNVATTDEISVLFQNYLDLAGQVGPIVGALTKEQADAWVDRLVEGGSRDPLGSCSSDVLRTLLRTSVARLRMSPTASSSAGSLGADSASNTKTDQSPERQGAADSLTEES